ncbi:exodeoxyribonuclease III [Dethiobacter alkaliphilus]|uniref:Exodeoxyribonuclease III Xth n=1 Tax=Dethiobacter alkaliphilus AHT 1 TaxID=555088 RepID=C0GFM8_DETAL|nr:exodeoxyribonuclease III [Dethiobacter alkaliphilus]EEG77988.1 exodeoxyribonuclease III Xth [Dethiobacter alkaliphilus AHT 1]
MKICTFNVNSVRAREELLLKWLEKRGTDIDVLCLQEIKVTDDKFPRQAFESLGYQCTVFGQQRYNGVAVCSKEGAQQVVTGFGDENWDQQKRIMHCRIGEVTVVNVYAPHGDLRGSEKYIYKQKWYRYFLEYLQRNFSPSDPLVVVGDLNVALEDLDVHDPKLLEDTVCTMPEERRWLQDVLDWGLVDSFRHLNPDAQSFTWWDYVGGAIWQDKGMRIDYILCSKPLAEKMAEVEVDLWPRRRRTPKPSDHAPVILSLNL